MQSQNLSFSTPESLGIPSQAIQNFLNELEEKRFCMHSFMLLRHGKVAAEGYWPPFDENRKHRMYSISKSFTAVAIGMMAEEGRVSLDSKVSDFFPEYLPKEPHPYVLEATVRDLLVMATFNNKTSYSRDSSDFTKTFFTDTGPKHKPGQIFAYDTAATTVLCAIVEKLSGMTMLEYMRPVLDEIGFSKDAYCIQTPEGRSWTGSGIMCTTRDLARFALLCVSGGEWNGKQLISREYIREATSWQIDSSVYGDGVEGRYGYGYQFWRIRKGGFAMNGMGSQYAVCMGDTILITTADNQGLEGATGMIFDAFYRLADEMSPGPLPEDTAAQAKLKEQISKLSMPLPLGKSVTPAGHISGRKYILDKNEAGMKWLRLNVEADVCRLQYENASGEHELVFGMGRYEPGLFPEKYSGRRIGLKDTNYQCICAGAWADSKTFLGTVYSVDDYLGHIKLQLTFTGNEVCGYMQKVAEWFFEEYQGFLAGVCE